MTTNTVKHTPDDAAPIELAGMFLEWQRIEDAKAELAEQSKDLFKAAKDKGYDTKAIRAVFREKRVELEASPEDAAKAEEAEAMNDLYRSALDRGLTARARPAHDAREIIEEFDAETGELTDNQEHASDCAVHNEPAFPAGACDCGTRSGASTEVRDTDAVSPPAGNVEGFVSEVSPSSDESEQDDVGTTASSTHHQISGRNGPAATGSTTDEAETSSAPVTHSHSSEIPLRSNTAGEAPSSNLPASPATIHHLRPVSQAAGSPASDAAPREAGATTAAASRLSSDDGFEPPAFLRKSAADYRPHCQRPDACGAVGLKHCYSCQKAVDALDREAVPA